MEAISNIVSGAVRSPSTVAAVTEPRSILRPEGKEQGQPITSARDEYIPSEKQEPTGCYWLGQDENGKPKICFDDPEKPTDPSNTPHTDAAAPEKKTSGGKAEKCTGSTDKVDREIEQLQKKQKELEQKINAETDAIKREQLESELAQVEKELHQKDNDTYRRQHTIFL